LHNFKQMLRNFDVGNKELQARVMTDRYIDEDGNERVDMLWEELIPEEMNDIDWNDPNDPYNIKAEAKLPEAVKQESEAGAQRASVPQDHTTDKLPLNFTQAEFDSYTAQAYTRQEVALLDK
jgi:hypothetical protein